jgi:hypothetical protein
VLALFERMYQGKLNGFICQGFNPLASAPHKAKIDAALAKLKIPGGDRPAGDRKRRSSGSTTTSSTRSISAKNPKTEVFSAAVHPAFAEHRWHLHQFPAG